MIISLDTYLYSEIKKRLHIMLKECYIINETLKDIDEEARTKFISTYVGEDPVKEVNIYYGVPQTKESFDAGYAITIGQSIENKKSLGGIEGSYDNRQGTVVEELALIEVSKTDATKLVFNTKYKVAEIEGITDISFSDTDDLAIVDGYITFNNNAFNEAFIGKSFTVVYTSLVSDESIAGVAKGFTSTDEVSITCLSTNYDTARCLDLIIKLILITMRDSVEEGFTYGLQNLAFDSLGPIITDGDLIVYGRSATMTYTVSSSVDSDFYKKVTEVIFRGRRTN